MWTVLHPHSADDFLLSASYCSPFFTRFLGLRTSKSYNPNVTSPGGRLKPPAVLGEINLLEICESISRMHAPLSWQISFAKRGGGNWACAISFDLGYQQPIIECDVSAPLWRIFMHYGHKRLKICSDPWWWGCWSGRCWLGKLFEVYKGWLQAKKKKKINTYYLNKKKKDYA